MDGYASAADEDDTQDASRAAFKAAEQVYRLSWTQAQRCRGSNGRRSRCAAPTPPATPAGYPGLLDLGPGAALPPDDVAVAVPAHGLGASVAVHRLTAHPGAFHVTGALSAQQQVRCCLFDDVHIAFIHAAPLFVAGVGAPVLDGGH